MLELKYKLKSPKQQSKSSWTANADQSQNMFMGMQICSSTKTNAPLKI